MTSFGMNNDFYSLSTLFLSLFKAREDVFAIRWEKSNKSGYMPAYFYDPYLYRTHKMKGGTFQNYADKSYLPLTEEQIKKHLEGQQHIGVYPLLKDNTSWFIVADFDEETWIADCKKFIEICRQKNIPAYLERSRSGNGGHVWIFFSKPVPAFKSRKIVLSLLVQSGVISAFDKNSSFDRLFPNQDALSGKGLGNLIALPLFKPCLEQGNNCFIDPETLQPFSDQWKFLSEIQKVSKGVWETLFNEIQNNSSVEINSQVNNDKLIISLSNVVKLNRLTSPLLLVNFLKEELNFANVAFIIKKNIGKNTFGTERYFRFITEAGKDILLPKGFVGKLLRFCKDNSIAFELNDQRKKLQPVSFSFDTALRQYQLPAIEASRRKDMGVIVAPPGTGKTIIGLKIIAEKQQPALIIVHRKQLMDQWMERIESFLAIPRHEIGKIGKGKLKIGEKITVGTIQSIIKELEKPDADKIRNAFGIILVDECHHIPAQTYRNAIQQFNSYYLYGLTATPFRKYNDGKLIFIHLGEIISEITTQQTGTNQYPTIIIRDTNLDVPFNSKTDRFETVSKILVHDSARNQLILQDITKELNAGEKVVVLTERKEHIETLQQYLKHSFEVVALSGEDAESSRNAKWKLLNAGNYQALITTGQFFGEGSDLQNASCLFLIYPFSFEGKLIQYIGRVQRSEIAPKIYDYRDIKVDYLNKLFLKRNTYYRRLNRQISLFDDPVDEELSDDRKGINANANASEIIEKEIAVPIELLEFRYGSVTFHYNIHKDNKIEFEIEHDDFRPEFEVLKPYFEKFLQSKVVKISIYVETEAGKVVAQLAISEDIKRINKEIIEAVRFQYITKSIFSKKKNNNQADDQNNHQILSQHPLYESGEELLEDILKENKFKHHQHLRYLANKHAGHLVKLRFVLQPFSFVFLLEGEKQFHIILETLDTEEATYVWHFDKDISKLPDYMSIINLQLKNIRDHGRQNFLTNLPPNFSRVLHDYSDEKKGFIIWKDMLEERLI